MNTYNKLKTRLHNKIEKKISLNKNGVYEIKCRCNTTFIDHIYDTN